MEKYIILLKLKSSADCFLLKAGEEYARPNSMKIGNKSLNFLKILSKPNINI